VIVAGCVFFYVTNSPPYLYGILAAAAAVQIAQYSKLPD
jgi:hypothetical protein